MWLLRSGVSKPRLCGAALASPCVGTTPTTCPPASKPGADKKTHR